MHGGVGYVKRVGYVPISHGGDGVGGGTRRGRRRRWGTYQCVAAPCCVQKGHGFRWPRPLSVCDRHETKLSGRMERNGTERNGTELNGTELNGTELNETEWNEMERTGTKRYGTKRNESERKRTDQIKLNETVLMIHADE